MFALKLAYLSQRHVTVANACFTVCVIIMCNKSIMFITALFCKALPKYVSSKLSRKYYCVFSRVFTRLENGRWRCHGMDFLNLLFPKVKYYGRDSEWVTLLKQSIVTIFCRTKTFEKVRKMILQCGHLTAGGAIILSKSWPEIWLF